MGTYALFLFDLSRLQTSSFAFSTLCEESCVVSIGWMAETAEIARNREAGGITGDKTASWVKAAADELAAACVRCDATAEKLR